MIPGIPGDLARLPPWPEFAPLTGAHLAQFVLSDLLQAPGAHYLLGLGALLLAGLYLHLWQRRKAAEGHTTELRALNEALRRSEEALRHSEDRFRRAFEHGPVGILMSSLNTRILRANRAFCQLLDATEPELQSIGLMDLAYPEDARRFLENTAQLHTGQLPRFEQEMRFVRRDKETLWAKVTTTVLTGPDQRPLCELSIIEDITARKRSERVLRQSEERFSKAFHSSPVPITITTLAEGRFVDANESFLRLTGHSRDELVGRSTTDLSLWPDPAERDAIGRLLLREGSLRGAELRIRTRQGEIRECLGSMETVELGQERCLLTLLLDITARKQTEAQLRRSEERFQLIARATNDTVWDWDIQQDRLWWNEGISTVFGHPANSIAADAKWWDEQIHPDDRSRILNSMHAAIDGTDQFWSADYRFRRGDDSYAEVFDRAYVQRDATGRAVRMIGAIMDMTERKRFLNELAMARDAAVEALRLKSEFLANISHEVRTPLNGIVGMTVLLQDTQLDQEQRSYVDTIASSTDALLTIINDILDFSKIEAGKLQFETLDFDLRNTIDSTIEILADRAQGKHIELITLVESDVPDRLRGDPGRLRQVITNLVVNAIKFTEQGEVVLHVNRVSETDAHLILMFTVRDTGIGIPQEALRYLFQAFSQVDGSTTRKFGGTGLGLTICKQLVELMGGQIGVESTLGQGSTFWFTARLEKQPAANHERIPPQPDLTGRRVLVLDHSESSRRMLQSTAASLGIEAAATAHPDEALRALQEAATAAQPFDLAILDTGPVPVDGYNFALSVRKDPALAGLRLLLIAPRGPHADTTFLRARGIGALLTKPVRQRLLIDTIARLLTPDAQHETRFWLDRRPIQRAATSIALPPGARQPLILVAEDNPINQRVALAILEKLGYKAQAVATGPEVLRALEVVPFDLILMDCQLPEIDGFETTREIRQRERRNPGLTNPVHIIAMTAMAQPGARERCLGAGMDDYLAKPVRIEALTGVLRRAMDRMANRLPAEPEPSTASPLPQHPPEHAIDRTALADLAQLSGPTRPDPVGEMATLFLRQGHACIREIELAITRYEAPEVERAAHSLRGSASTLGATALAKACAAIEEQAHKGSLQVAANLLNTLRVEFSRARDELLTLQSHNPSQHPIQPSLHRNQT